MTRDPVVSADPAAPGSAVTRTPGTFSGQVTSTQTAWFSAFGDVVDVTGASMIPEVPLPVLADTTALSQQVAALQAQVTKLERASKSKKKPAKKGKAAKARTAGPRTVCALR